MSMINKPQRPGQIIYRGQCVDSNDPMRLGRIRAYLKTENTSDRELANENQGKKLYKEWDEKDPFVFKPLLPFFINTPPKDNEYVHLFYSNLDNKGSKDRFYIGGVYSSPTTSNFESYDSAVTNLDLGSRNKSFSNLLNNEGEYFYKNTEGVYSEPDDVTLYGRGNADIVIQEGTVLLRAGKNNNYKRGQVPSRNEKRSFLQLSKFDKKTVQGEPEKKYIFEKKDSKLKVLIEYNVINIENNSNLFSGDISIYNVSNTDGVDASKMSMGMIIPESSKSLMTRVSFTIKSMTDIINLISDITTNMVKYNSIENIVDEDTVGIVIDGPVKFDAGNIYPMYVRPQSSLYNKTNSPNLQEKTNINTLMSSLKVKKYGYGLIFNKSGDNSVPFVPKKETLTFKKTEFSDKSVGILGGDEIFLLSHNSQKFNKGKIDLSGTIYGIDEEKVSIEMMEKTSSTVRGEELLELINLIVRFLVAHVHPYPGLPPVPQSIDNVKVDDILKELLNAQDKILNKNIRIN